MKCPFIGLLGPDGCVYMQDEHCGEDGIEINAGNSDAKCREALEKLTGRV